MNSAGALIDGMRLLASLYLCPSRWTDSVEMTRSVLVRRLLPAATFLLPLITTLMLLPHTRNPAIIGAGILHGFILAAAGTWAIATLVSVPSAFAGALAIGPAFGYAFSLACLRAGGIERLAARFQDETMMASVGAGATAGAYTGTIISLAIGIAGYLTAAPSGKRFEGRFWNLAAGSLFGIVAAMAAGLCLVSPIYFVQSTIGLAALSVMFGVVGAVGAGVTCVIQDRDRRAVAIASCGCGVLLGLSVWIMKAAGSPTLGLLMSGASKALLYSILFGLGFAMGRRIGGPAAGAAASAFGSSAGFFALRMLAAPDTPWIAIPFSWFAMAIGLMLPLWLPVLLYPFEAAWNNLIYRLDLRRTSGRGGLLRYNSAFWDEHQRLPADPLESHLVLALENGGDSATQLARRLAAGRRRDSVRRAWIELDARNLERCDSVVAIAGAFEHTGIAAEPSSASAIVQRFVSLSRDISAALQHTDRFNEQAALRAVGRHVEELSADLMRNAAPEAARFLAAAGHWSSLVHGHLRALDAAIEERREIRNPYVIGVPLNQDQEIFVGRTEITARILSLLLGNLKPPLLLHGQRRMGKTSLLNNLGRLLPSAVVPCFVDLQGPATMASDSAGFFYNVARGMTESAHRFRRVQLPAVNREYFARDPFTSFDEWLDTVEEAIGSRTALIALDEFEALDAAVQKGRFDGADILGSFRHIAQHRTRLKLLFSGSHTLDEMKHWASHLVHVQTLPIGSLSGDEARKLIEMPVKDFRLRYEPEAVARILALTSRHPCLIQLLCHQVVTRKNSQPVENRLLATIQDVEAAAPVALERGTFFFQDIANRAGDAAAEYLRALARGNACPVAEAELARLLRREIIEPAPAGYRFSVELVRMWFAAR